MQTMDISQTSSKLSLKAKWAKKITGKQFLPLTLYCINSLKTSPNFKVLGITFLSLRMRMSYSI